MRIESAHLLRLSLAGSLTLAAVAASPDCRQVGASGTSTSHETLGNSFVARLVSVESGMGPMFVAHLRDCYLPVWNRLRNDEVVITVSVFELIPYDSTTTDSSARDYLVLAELGPGTKPDDLLDAERAPARSGRRHIPKFVVLRSALMSCTPNSCYGTPELTYQDSASEIDFLVEFIGVEETPPVLGKYREIVSNYVGPANGILVERGMLHCFVALENVNILSDTLGAVPWNQIHISDDWDVGGEVDWDSVYVELFREEFSCDLDSLWAEVPPTDKTRADYHGRLVSELCVR